MDELEELLASGRSGEAIRLVCRETIVGAEKLVGPYLAPGAAEAGPRRFLVAGVPRILVDGAPPHVEAAAAFLNLLTKTCAAIHDGDSLMAVFFALETGVAMAAAGIACDNERSPLQVLTSFGGSQKGRSDGGTNSRKWTPEVAAIGRPIFERHAEKGVGRSQAATRTAAELMEKHGIELSPRTVLRGIPELDTA